MLPDIDKLSSEFDASLEQQSDDMQDGWITSYADLMSLLLCFFVILYSLANVTDRDFQQFAEQISEGFKGNKKEQQSPMDHGTRSKSDPIRAVEMLTNLLNVQDSERLIELIAEAYHNEKLKQQILKKMKGILDINLEITSENTAESFTIVYPVKTLLKPNGELSSKGRLAMQELASVVNGKSSVYEIEIGRKSNNSDERHTILRSNIARFLSKELNGNQNVVIRKNYVSAKALLEGDTITVTIHKQESTP